ncbi:serine hydrolase domain-containing protein [Microbulbifer sp. CnH-101-G]|uniref:serine hydrolase domain-containing protein n=1 Tax=Microbulbifer sp. CnH-101-G TaxID=3243393 RepID=UPI004039ED96
MNSHLHKALKVFLLTLLTYAPILSASTDVQEKLRDVLEGMRKEHKLVGVGSVILQRGQVIAQHTSGEREVNSGVSLSKNDKWHLGSITKSITATMIARLVEKGVLNWESTMGDIFAKEKAIDKQWQKVTLRQLLTHTSGAPTNFSADIQAEHPKKGKQRIQHRYNWVVEILNSPLSLNPGESFSYSNVGYTVAGVIAETVTGQSWEELIEQEVFKPLGIESAGFGPPGERNRVNVISQPRGHIELPEGKYSVGIGNEADNSPIMGPAGSVHMSLQDLSQYAFEHLQGIKGNGSLLNKETYQLIHTPALNLYSFGWVQSTFGDETHIWHNGSNTYWYSYVGLFPSRDLVITFSSNDGSFFSNQHLINELLIKILGDMDV